MDFRDRVVVITGASSGIGAAAAILFANQSAKVVLVGRNETSLNEVAIDCEQAKGYKPLIIKADLTVDEDVKRIIHETIEKFQRIDVLVNNAGVGLRGSISDGVEAFDRAMNINMRAAYLLTSLAVPYLISSKGNVMNVSSVVTIKPPKQMNLTPYCIAKAALDEFTKCMAVELGPKGVRVNSVNPGLMRTRFMENSGYNETETNYIYTVAENATLLSRLVQSEEVADLILYLASDRARSITGSSYVIDSGYLLF